MMKARLLARPGWASALLVLLLWVLGLGYFFITTKGAGGFWNYVWFQTRLAWPNLMLVYLIVTGSAWFLEKRYLGWLAAATALLMVVVIALRYANNLAINPNYYQRPVGPGGAMQHLTGLEIAGEELFKVAEMVLIAYAVRLVMEWQRSDTLRAEAEQAQMAAELSALRMQLGPHFMLNALNNIHGLVLQQSAHASDAVLKLSALLRYSLYEKEDRVMLSHELDYMANYIAFQQIRYPNDHIELHIAVPDADRQKLIAPLVLSPFLENAFKHGLPGTAEAPTTIHISTVQQCLHYQVTNSLQPNGLQKPGTGLANLQRRLQWMYPNQYQIHYQPQGNRYVASLQIPLQA